MVSLRKSSFASSLNLEHKYSNRVLIGAPKSNSSHPNHQHLFEPGVVYKCDLDNVQNAKCQSIILEQNGTDCSVEKCQISRNNYCLNNPYFNSCKFQRRRSETSELAWWYHSCVQSTKGHCSGQLIALYVTGAKR